MLAHQESWPFSALCTTLFTILSLTLTSPARAFDPTVSGRVMFGAAWRMQAPDPALLVSVNAAQVGLEGYANSGQNTDDANLNFQRGDATTRAVHAFVDLTARHGPFSAMARVKGWHDFALNQHPRGWGNNPSDYVAGRPLSDAGAARLSRFSGVALGDAYLQYLAPTGRSLLLRLGQQSLPWGEQAAFGGGLAAVNSVDQPALRRAGAAPQELRVPTPMLFARVGMTTTLALEGFYGSAFRASALDMCGTFWATTDYLAQGCNRAYSGALAVSDRARLATGAFLKRVDGPRADGGPQFGAGLTWKSGSGGLGAELGAYAVRTTQRTPIPGLRKSTRIGPSFIAGDLDGRNLAFFTEHPERVTLVALTAAYKHAASHWYGELAYRPHQALQLPPGDVLPAFLSPTAPSLIRADANATAPGAYFSGYDRRRTVQLQLGWQHTFAKQGPVLWRVAADVIGKHVVALPDPATRRYGRPDQYGAGPINGVCMPNSRDLERQCSFDGYVSPSAFGYRLRADARVAALRPGLNLHASALFAHDVQGWSHDFLLSEGRKSVNLALRFEYRGRYLAELAYVPVWGGRYGNQHDKDVLILAAGVKF